MSMALAEMPGISAYSSKRLLYSTTSIDGDHSDVDALDSPPSCKEPSVDRSFAFVND